MDAPALVLVPSSPLDLNPSSKVLPLSSKNSSPVSSDDSYTTSSSISHHATPSSPPSSYGITIESEPGGRNSSESTIFSIYSMYSERRQTWRKSALRNSTILAGAGVGLGLGLGTPSTGMGAGDGSGGGGGGGGKEYHRSRGSSRNGSRESGKDLCSDDSFYRGGANTTSSISRQSSSGSGFFAGSASADSSSRHQSNAYSSYSASGHNGYTGSNYNYNHASLSSSSPPQSRPASAGRRVGSFLDTSGNNAFAFDGNNDAPSSRPGSTTELAYGYANEDSLPSSSNNYSQGAPLPRRNISPDAEADTHAHHRYSITSKSATAPTSQRLQSAKSAPAGVDLGGGNYVDLTSPAAQEDEGRQHSESYPDLSTMRRHSPSPGSGKVHDSPRLSSTGMENADKPLRPPRGSPPLPSQNHSQQTQSQTRAQVQEHAKSDSTSTAAHYGLIFSPNSSAHGHGSGIDGMSSTHESGYSYATAPQSVESSGSHTQSITSSLRFRVTNPDPPTSPSPPPHLSPANHTSSYHGSTTSSHHSQKGLPTLPDTSIAATATGTAGNATLPSENNGLAYVNRQSSVSSITVPGRTTSDSSSSHRSRVPGGEGLSEAVDTSAGVGPGADPAKGEEPPSAEPKGSPSPSAGAGAAAGEAEAPTSRNGEEPESFFVRNTYAQLDVTGVKGDGYEEGVERTRAKLGHDRRSVQMALRNDARGDIRGELSEEEVRLLKSVDRYGFFNKHSHDRIVILPSSALSKPLNPLPQSSTPTSSPASPPVLSSEPKPRAPSKDLETKRISKWGRMLEAEGRDAGGNVAVWRVKSSKEKKLRARVFKGIPDAWRAAAWEVLVARWVGRRKKESLDARRLESMLSDLRREYRSSLDRPSSYDVQIDLDVPRTISGHVMFKTRYGKGQRSLFHTLHSFSLVCDECGYCQGMGPIAATLLCYYDPEKVYSFLVHFHDEYELHDIFLPGFPGLLEAIYVQERVMERMMPAVFASFKKHMISTTSYATKWYITLFANSVPFQTQLRIWDVFLLEGRDVFVIVAVAIIWVFRDHLTSAQANFETVLSLLSSFFVPEDDDALLRWMERAMDDKKLRAEMNRWREEWRGLVREKKDGGVLL